MSLSEYSPASFSQRGHSRKLVSVQLTGAEEPSSVQKALTQLRDYFASRVDLLNKDSVISSIEHFIVDEIPESRREEIVQAALTRRQRKVTRGLGFVVQYQGPWIPEL